MLKWAKYKRTYRKEKNRTGFRGLYRLSLVSAYKHEASGAEVMTTPLVPPPWSAQSGINGGSAFTLPVFFPISPGLNTFTCYEVNHWDLYVRSER